MELLHGTAEGPNRVWARHEAWVHCPHGHPIMASARVGFLQQPSFCSNSVGILPHNEVKAAGS